MEVRRAAVTGEAFAAPVDRWYGSTVRLAWLLARDETTAETRRTRSAARGHRRGTEVTPVAVLRATVERAAGQHIAARAVGSRRRPRALRGCRPSVGRLVDGRRSAAGTRAHSRRPRGGARARRPRSGVSGSRRASRRRATEPEEEVQRVVDFTPADQREFLAYGRARVWEALGMNDLALTCSGLTDLVTDYLDNALDPHRALSFEMHAVFCPGCRVFVTQMRETVERLTVAAAGAGLPARARGRSLSAFRSGPVIAYKFLRAGRLRACSAAPSGRT